MKCAQWSYSRKWFWCFLSFQSCGLVFAIFFFASRKFVMSSVESRSLDALLQLSPSLPLFLPLSSFIFLLKLLCCSKCVESLEAGKETFSEQDGPHLPDLLPFLHKNHNLMLQEAAGQAPPPPHPKVVMRISILFVWADTSMDEQPADWYSPNLSSIWFWPFSWP